MKIKKGLEKDFEKFIETNSRDPYSKATVDYLIAWADLMEKEKEITKEIAEKTSHDADTDGITGFMYDMARRYLHKYWEYGEDLTKVLGDKMTSVLIIKEK